MAPHLQRSSRGWSTVNGSSPCAACCSCQFDEIASDPLLDQGDVAGGGDGIHDKSLPESCVAATVEHQSWPRSWAIRWACDPAVSRPGVVGAGDWAVTQRDATRRRCRDVGHRFEGRHACRRSPREEESAGSLRRLCAMIGVAIGLGSDRPVCA